MGSRTAHTFLNSQPGDDITLKTAGVTLETAIILDIELVGLAGSCAVRARSDPFTGLTAEIVTVSYCRKDRRNGHFSSPMSKFFAHGLLMVQVMALSY
jgi:hypothetical protein